VWTIPRNLIKKLFVFNMNDVIENNRVCTNSDCSKQFHHEIKIHSHRYKGLCIECNKKRKYELKKNSTNLKVSNQKNTNKLLANKNKSLLRELKVAKKTIDNLSLIVENYKRPRVTSTVEQALLNAQLESDASKKENIILKNKLTRVEGHLNYSYNLFVAPSKYKNQHGNSPGKGLYSFIFIKNGDKFIEFVGDTVSRPSGSVKDSYSKQDVKYLLHLDKETILDCSKTNKLGVCRASMINCVQGLFLRGIAAVPNAYFPPAVNGVKYAIATRDILPKTEIFIETYGKGFCINELLP
jgi:hypothetical protein